MSLFDLINFDDIVIWNLSLNFDVAFRIWLDKFLPPTPLYSFIFVNLQIY